MAPDPFEYDLALSFAEEDNAIARQLADQLVQKNLKVFLDRYTSADSGGKDVLDHLVNLYARKSRYVVLLVSRHYPLKSWTAGEIAKLPTYYVMDLAKDMAATVAEEMPSAAEIAANKWLPDSELAFYSAEYARNGFQGGLQWYRCGTSGAFLPELQTWSGRTIDIPSAFISGKQDWGTYQRPGVYEAMQSKACINMIGCHLVDGAGHWVQQEQANQVSWALVQFLQDAKARAKA